LKHPGDLVLDLAKINGHVHTQPFGGKACLWSNYLLTLV